MNDFSKNNLTSCQIDKKNVSEIEMAWPNEGCPISFGLAKESIWLCMVYLIEQQN